MEAFADSYYTDRERKRGGDVTVTGMKAKEHLRRDRDCEQCERAEHSQKGKKKEEGRKQGSKEGGRIEKAKKVCLQRAEEEGGGRRADGRTGRRHHQARSER